MPKLPGVNHQEAIRALEKVGFRVARQGGKHAVMTDGVIHDAGLTIEQFKKLL
jgi:predicted RNA binding protein YcfA (HicA-like mRNA interferase family)